MLNWAPPEVLDTVIAFCGPNFVNVTSWLVLKGWLGKYMLWACASIIVSTSPTV